MRNWLLFSLLFLFFPLCGINTQQLDSNTVKILLYTYEPGNNLYSLFGHSALRVTDNQNQTDYFYNYGTFDFDEPFFYLKFIKGNLLYRVSRLPSEYVIKSFAYEDRNIMATELMLSINESTKLKYFLENNYLPENRYYLYDFFNNNCATRIYDALNSVTKNRFNYYNLQSTETSYRNLIYDYTKSKPIIALGIDIVMGISADKKIQTGQRVFLPRGLYTLLDNSYDTINSTKLTSETFLENIVVQPKVFKIQFSNFLFMLFLFYLLLFDLIGLKSGRNPFNLQDKVIVILSSFLGLVICFLWIYSEHEIFSLNYNLLCLNPLLILLLGEKYQKKRIIVFTLFILGIIGFALLVIYRLSLINILFDLILLSRLFKLIIKPLLVPDIV